MAIDGSKFKAVNSKERNYTEGKLKERIQRLETKRDVYLKDREEATAEQEKSGEIIEGLEERKARYEGYADELEERGKARNH